MCNPVNANLKPLKQVKSGYYQHKISDAKYFIKIYVYYPRLFNH